MLKILYTKNWQDCFLPLSSEGASEYERIVGLNYIDLISIT